MASSDRSTGSEDGWGIVVMTPMTRSWAAWALFWVRKGGAVMERTFGLAGMFGRVFPGRCVVGAPGPVVFGCGASSLMRLARTAVSLTLLAASFLSTSTAIAAAEVRH